MNATEWITNPAAALKKARKEAKLSQEKTAELAGLHLNTVALIEKGRKPRHASLVALINAFTPSIK